MLCGFFAVFAFKQKIKTQRTQRNEDAKERRRKGRKDEARTFHYGADFTKTLKNADVCAILRRLRHGARRGANIEVLERQIWLRGSKIQVFAQFGGLRRRGAKYWTSLACGLVAELTARSRRRF